MTSSPKYKLLKDDTKTIGDNTLFRVKYLKDVGLVSKGDLGGYIEKELNLSHAGNALVYDNAHVSGDALVYDNARVYGNEVICTRLLFKTRQHVEQWVKFESKMRELLKANTS